MPPVGKIAQLPDDIRAWLHKAIVERGFGDIVGLTEELNALCKDGGVSITIGKSAVGVESQRVRRAQEAIKATTEAARLLAETSPDDADNRSAAVMALVQNETFDVLLQLRESQDIEDPLDRLGAMSQAALLISRLSRTSVNQKRWAAEVDKSVKAAAARVTKLARAGGADPKTIAEIRAQILGITKQRQAAESAT